MADIITHARFDRPKVVQPSPRRRKGTISFRQRRAELLMAKRLNGRSTAQVRQDSQRDLQARETVSKVMCRMVQQDAQEDARKADMLPVYLANDLSSLRFMHAMRALGVELDFNGARNAFVLRALDRPAT